MSKPYLKKFQNMKHPSARGRACWGSQQHVHFRPAWQESVCVCVYSLTSDQTRLPAEFKHINKQRKRKLTRIPLVTASEAGPAQT